MMVHMTKSTILYLIQLEPIQPFYCKVGWGSPNICSGWVCKAEDCKEGQYDRYGLFLLVWWASYTFFSFADENSTERAWIADFIMELCNQWCSPVWLAGPCLSIHSAIFIGRYGPIFNWFFFSFMLSVQTSLMSTFLYHFTGLDLDLRPQGQQKIKPVSFIFLHIFQLIKMKSDVV